MAELSTKPPRSQEGLPCRCSRLRRGRCDAGAPGTTGARPVPFFFFSRGEAGRSQDEAVADTGDAIKTALLTEIEPHWSVSAWAPYLGITRDKLYRLTQAVTSLSDPLAPGKSVRALLLNLGETKPVKRIPESRSSAYWEVQHDFPPEHVRCDPGAAAHCVVRPGRRRRANGL